MKWRIIKAEPKGPKSYHPRTDSYGLGSMSPVLSEAQRTKPPRVLSPAKYWLRHYYEVGQIKPRLSICQFSWAQLSQMYSKSCWSDYVWQLSHANETVRSQWHLAARIMTYRLAEHYDHSSLGKYVNKKGIDRVKFNRCLLGTLTFLN